MSWDLLLLFICICICMCSFHMHSLFKSEELQQKLLREVFSLVSKRDENVCNFLEIGSNFFSEQDCRIIYRHYATLYFVFCVDATESELGILDLIQVFVESLDKSFESVCELDLIFHSDKVGPFFELISTCFRCIFSSMN